MLSYDALFAAEQLPGPGLERLLGAALGSARAPQGLAVGTAPVLRHAGECGARGAVGTGRAGSGDNRTWTRPRSAAAGPLCRALRLPLRLLLRVQGGRERDLHLPLPPRLLQEPRHLLPRPGPPAPLPVSALGTARGGGHCPPGADGPLGAGAPWAAISGSWDCAVTTG